MRYVLGRNRCYYLTLDLILCHLSSSALQKCYVQGIKNSTHKTWRWRTHWQRQQCPKARRKGLPRQRPSTWISCKRFSTPTHGQFGVGITGGDMCHLPCYSNNFHPSCGWGNGPFYKHEKKQLISVESITAWLKEQTPQKKSIYNTDLSGMLFHHRPINTRISSISASSTNVFIQVVRNSSCWVSVSFSISKSSRTSAIAVSGSLPHLLYLNHALKTALLTHFFMLHAWALGRRVGWLVGAVQISIAYQTHIKCMGLEFLRAASNTAIFSSLDPSVAASSISFNSSSWSSGSSAPECRFSLIFRSCCLLLCR